MTTESEGIQAAARDPNQINQGTWSTQQGRKGKLIPKYCLMMWLVAKYSKCQCLSTNKLDEQSTAHHKKKKKKAKESNGPLAF